MFVFKSLDYSPQSKTACCFYYGAFLFDQGIVVHRTVKS